MIRTLALLVNGLCLWVCAQRVYVDYLAGNHQTQSVASVMGLVFGLSLYGALRPEQPYVRQLAIGGNAILLAVVCVGLMVIPFLARSLENPPYLLAAAAVVLAIVTLFNLNVLLRKPAKPDPYVELDSPTVVLDFECERSIREICATLNALGPWEWVSYPQTGRAARLTCRPQPNVSIQLCDPYSFRGDGPKYQVDYRGGVGADRASARETLTRLISALPGLKTD